MSLGKVLGLLYGLMGFAGGLIMLAVTLVSGPPKDVSGPLVHLFGLGAPVFITLVYGALGFVTGYVGAWLYNIVSKKIGGVKVEIEGESN